MAEISKDNAYMDFPLQISRQYAAQIEKNDVWYDKSELETYAKSSPISFAGQRVSLVNVETDELEVYGIKPSGTLVKIGSNGSEIQIPDNSITTVKIADNAVTLEKLDTNVVSLFVPRGLSVLPKSDLTNRESKIYLDNNGTAEQTTVQELFDLKLRTVTSVPDNLQKGDYIFLELTKK